MEDLFAPPDTAWQPLSPAYAMVRRIGALIGLAVLALVLGGILWTLTSQPWTLATVAAVTLALGAFQWWRLGRWVAAWGYAERPQELYLRHGLWFRQLTVVPYGRLQVVKVESGPIERALGLASVTLVTASAQSNARIPGLPAATAAKLRDRLVEVGQALEAGL